VVVVINDRGPFGGRIIDLSPEAFSALAPLGQGVMQVRLTW
jgi:rare lipoprotein A (peptidoglycan hydrolase)